MGINNPFYESMGALALCSVNVLRRYLSVCPIFSFADPDDCGSASSAGDGILRGWTKVRETGDGWRQWSGMAQETGIFSWILRPMLVYLGRIPVASL
jgi:hypothetical protein